ncbi:MAG: hypothetical protein N2512_10315 [Armatimonadetes bacterium]|nr:hypothetical protein [Armatimonadota bacterium]
MTMLAMISLCLAAANGPTAVFWASAPVAPGEVTLLSGVFPRAEELVVGVERLADGKPGLPAPVASAPARKPTKMAQMLQASDSALLFELPDLGGPGVYVASIYRKDGEKLTPVAAVRLNAPEVWWLLGDAGGPSEPRKPGGPPPLVFASPGGWLRITGRCLTLGDGKPKVLFIPRPSGQPVDLAVQEAAPWHVAVRLPDTLKPGTTGIIALHNGKGPASSWGMSEYSVRIVPRTTLPSQVYDLDRREQPADAGAVTRRPYPEVRPTVIDAAGFGADGADSADDTAAIQAALNEAAKAPGVAVVSLPRGRFFISAPLQIPPYTLLRGAGVDLTAICIPETDTPPQAWVQGSHHFALLDFTLFVTTHRHVIAGDMSADPTRAGHVAIRRVRVRADLYRGHLEPKQVAERFEKSLQLSTGGGDTLRFSGPDVVVADCDVYGSGRSIYFHRVLGGLVAGNHLYNGRWGWYNFNGCNDVVIVDNAITGADLMSTGGSYSAYGPETDTVNFYTAHNRYELMHGWDREAFTSDAGGGVYRGQVAAARWADGLLEVELAGDAALEGRWKGSLFAVVGGRARGFVAQVVDYEGRRVMIKPLTGPGITNVELASTDAWASLFDHTTLVTITQLHRRYVFYDNETYDAGIAIQFFGTSVEHVCAQNRCWRSGGFHGWALDYWGIQPVIDCQWFGNEVLEGNSWGAGVLGPSHVAAMGFAPSVNLNSVFRGNHLHNNASLEVLAQGDPTAVENVVMEGNVVEKADAGLRVQGGVGIVYRNNKFVECVREVDDIARRLEEYRQKIAAAASEKEPIAAWSFDEVGAANTSPGASSVGFNLPALLRGGATLAPGQRGQALKLDGSGYAEVSTDDACYGLNLTNFTVAAWIYPEVVQGRWGIVAKRTGHAGTPFVVCVQNGSLTFEACDAQGQWTSYNFSGPPALTPGQWQHVAAVVEEGKRVTLYLDGKEYAAREVPGARLATNDHALRIGWEAWGGDPPKGETPGPFHGLIDEVKIWARPLSAEEVASEASSP